MDISKFKIFFVPPNAWGWLAWRQRRHPRPRPTSDALDPSPWKLSWAKRIRRKPIRSKASGSGSSDCWVKTGGSERKSEIEKLKNATNVNTTLLATIVSIKPCLNHDHKLQSILRSVFYLWFLFNSIQRGHELFTLTLTVSTHHYITCD